MNDTNKSWLFVLVQAILLVLLIFFTNGQLSVSKIIKILGLTIEFLGVIILLISFYDLRKSLTALPLPKQNGVMQIGGLYKYVRHPMYVGVLILSIGITIGGNSIAKYFILVGLFVLFNVKARYEETLLIAKYPGYKTYMLKTPRFIPRLPKF